MIPGFYNHNYSETITVVLISDRTEKLRFIILSCHLREGKKEKIHEMLRFRKHSGSLGSVQNISLRSSGCHPKGNVICSKFTVLYSVHFIVYSIYISPTNALIYLKLTTYYNALHVLNIIRFCST